MVITEIFKKIRNINKEPTALLKSQICTQEKLESKSFQDWAEHLGERPGHLHRKVWEWCFITEALYELKLLKPGISGLGFAVGTEPLASCFCSFGVSVCATDLFNEIAKERGWVETNQHASGLESVNSRNLCSEKLFNKNCTFRYVDMNNIPNDIGDFDFIWSSCALEHLGSLMHGEEFIYNAMKCLRPGGFAIHTTEYNYSSNSDTISSGGTVLYRRQDIEKIVSNLRKEGHYIEVIFTGGSLPNDLFIDTPPTNRIPISNFKLQGML